MIDTALLSVMQKDELYGDFLCLPQEFSQQTVRKKDVKRWCSYDQKKKDDAQNIILIKTGSITLYTRNQQKQHKCDSTCTHTIHKYTAIIGEFSLAKL